MKRIALKRKAYKAILGSATEPTPFNSSKLKKQSGPWLKRKTPLRRMSKRRHSEYKEYMRKRAIFLAEHPICQLWCAENGWNQVGEVYAKGIGELELLRSAQELIIRYGAPKSNSLHHKNGRHGKNYLDESTWMACSAANHSRIEANKSWARANGYLGKK